MSNYYENLFTKAENIDVDINHLENIFTDETYYAAMKIVPLLERKVLYLSYIENIRLNDICKRLKLQKKDIIKLRNKGISHFKSNLATIEELTLASLLATTNKVANNVMEFIDDEHELFFVSKIIGCTYAPYFYEGVKLRYSEYTNEKSNERIPNIKLLEMER